MRIKNVSENEIRQAIAEVNKLYDDNIRVYIEATGKQFKVNLTVFDSHGKGAHLGFSGRHTIYACWHVYGFFFENLLKINPNAKITTVLARIDKNGGNWTDKNIGSQMSPLMASEACECSEFINTELCVNTNNVFLRQPIEVNENTQIKNKVFTDYDALDALATKLGFKAIEGDNSLTGWIPTIGDESHNTYDMLREAMQKLNDAQVKYTDAILGFCQTGAFSIGYTVYVKA